MSSTASSTRSGGASGSSTSTSASDSVSTPSTIFSQTFTPPSASSTSTIPSGGGGGGGGGGGSGGNNAGWNGPSIASSASLYLYTFLATLVLLLSVSAAIILRSLVLRRRHRRMVEEAIRNGTWIPPSPGALAGDGAGAGAAAGGFGGRVHAHAFGPGRARAVDLSKKPKMWQAFVRPAGVAVGAGADAEKGRRAARRASVRDEEKRAEAVWDPLRAERAEDRETEGECEWDSLKPITVAYLVPPLPGTTTHALPLPGGTTRQQQQQPPPLLSGRTQEQAEEQQQQQQQGRRRRRGVGVGTRTVLRRILHALSPTPATPSSPLPHPLTPAPASAAAPSAAGEASEQHGISPVTGSAHPGMGAGARQDDAAPPPAPAAVPAPVVQVAVLIAMPSAAKPHYLRPSLTSPNPVPSPSSSTHARPPPIEADASTGAAPGPSTPTSSDSVPPDSPEARRASGSVPSRYPSIASTGPRRAGTGVGDEDRVQDGEDAEPRLLPHIEFGIAKVEMKLDDVSSVNGTEGAPMATATGALQGKMMRISVASSMDVV